MRRANFLKHERVSYKNSSVGESPTCICLMWVAYTNPTGYFVGIEDSMEHQRRSIFCGIWKELSDATICAYCLFVHCTQSTPHARMATVDKPYLVGSSDELETGCLRGKQKGKNRYIQRVFRQCWVLGNPNSNSPSRSTQRSREIDTYIYPILSVSFSKVLILYLYELLCDDHKQI